jgi:hypothetical protein
MQSQMTQSVRLNRTGFVERYEVMCCEVSDQRWSKPGRLQEWEDVKPLWMRGHVALSKGGSGDKANIIGQLILVEIKGAVNEDMWNHRREATLAERARRAKEE